MNDESKITWKIGASAFTTYVTAVMAAGGGVACAVGAIVLVRSDAPTNWGIVALLVAAAGILGFGAVGQWHAADTVLDFPEKFPVGRREVRRTRRSAEALLMEQRPSVDRRWSADDWCWAYEQLDTPVSRQLASKNAAMAALARRQQ